MTTDPITLARRLAVVAQDLDARGYRFAGVVRQAARHLAGHQGPPPAGTCGWCHRQLEGRQRAWCSPACRARAYRARSAPCQP